MQVNDTNKPSAGPAIALIEPAVRAECLTTEVFAQIRASLPFLAGALRDEGIAAAVFCEEIVDLSMELPSIAAQYGFAGISVTINTVRRAIEIADALRKADPAIKIIFGGHVAGNYAEELLRHGDACLTGRAERTLPLLIKALAEGGEISNIPNLCYIGEDGRVARTRRGSLARDAASDFGAVRGYGGFSARPGPFGFKKPPLYSLFTSTGCVNRCRFCVSEKEFVPRALEHVSADLERILDLHSTLLPPRIMIVDDCPFGDMAHLRAVLDAMALARRKRRFSAMMQFHVKPLINEKGLAAAIKNAGIETLLLGFESASNEALAAERKGTTTADNEAAIAVCREHGITPYGYFVAGFDSDTPASVRATFDFIKKHRLVAQVLPMGVMELDGEGRRIEGGAATLDPYSFGASMKVSHRPAKMGPAELQRLLVEGYDEIYSFSRIFSMRSAREALFQAAFAACYRKWRPGLVKHLNYLSLLEKFNIDERRT